MMYESTLLRLPDARVYVSPAPGADARWADLSAMDGGRFLLESILKRLPAEELRGFRAASRAGRGLANQIVESVMVRPARRAAPLHLLQPGCDTSGRS